jgi:hypothetical protein
MKYLARTIILPFVLLAACKPTQMIHDENSGILKNILNRYPQYFENIFNNTEHHVQIIYTQIERGKNKKIKFTDHYLNVNDDDYFYPASTVKLPVAILALQRLNELNIPGLNKNTTMITETDDEDHTAVYNDPTTSDGRPTIASYIKKILLVSDNDAFNRLYEFLGQEYINNSLHELGYNDVQIIHRLDISMTEDQNRYANPVNFLDSNGKILYAKPSGKSQLVYATRNTKMGKGYYRKGQLVNEPFDFSQKNRMSLKSLHGILRSIIFPEMISSRQRFRLTNEDYSFLRKYMSMMPRESKYPAYDPVNYRDTYVKFLLYGSEKVTTDPGIRIFNKVGDAYGFLIDVAYIVDFKNNIEFMLSAVIYCNSDGIFNDDKYDYDTVGFPFMKRLGQVIYQHELKRHKKHLPDFGKIIFDYSR